MRHITSRLTYANVTATLALFVALGGASYAAVSLPRNSVGTAQIKPRAVVLSKVSPKTRRALRGQRGKTGPQGIQGVQGIQGIQGVRGLQGPPGPTAGAAASGGGDPSSTPVNALSSLPATLTTTAPGRIFVFGSVSAGLGCQASGSCTDAWGVYIDGVPVPGTASGLSAAASGSTTKQINIFGISAVVPAGTHSVAFRDNPGGNWGSVSQTGSAVGAIALGS
jgi:hypothetical protein